MERRASRSAASRGPCRTSPTTTPGRSGSGCSRCRRRCGSASSMRSTPSPVMSAVSSGCLNDSCDEADGAEVVDLVGLHLLDGGDERREVAQVAFDELERRVLVEDELDLRVGLAAHEPEHLVALAARNSDRCRPSWPVMPVTSARFMAADPSGTVLRSRLGRRIQSGSTRSQSGSSWWRNSAQRCRLVRLADRAGGLARARRGPGGSRGWSRGASARSPSRASPTGGAGRDRGGTPTRK